MTKLISSIALWGFLMLFVTYAAGREEDAQPLLLSGIKAQSLMTQIHDSLTATISELIDFNTVQVKANEPTPEPSPEPTAEPTVEPTAEPTASTSALPFEPTAEPTGEPTAATSLLPFEPSAEPTAEPTAATSGIPDTAAPTAHPTIEPFEPTAAPTTSVPTAVPSAHPTIGPFEPTEAPTATPTMVPSILPTAVPSTVPSSAPTAQPTTLHPTYAPGEPTPQPTTAPTAVSTVTPTSAAPTPLPTAKPSRSPTISPTKNDLIEFAAAQEIDGVSIDDYNSDPDAYDLTLQESIAETMDGVDADNVQDLTVTAADPSRRSLLDPLGVLDATGTALRSTSGGRRLATEAIEASYVVSVRDQGQSYNSLSTQLSDAVSSGQFDSYLHTNAALNGATGLENATSSSVSTTNLLSGGGGSSKKKKSSDDDDEGLSGGAVAGIVIGVLAGVVIIAAIAYFMLRGGALDSNGYSKHRDSYMDRGLSEIATTPLRGNDV